jgi:hypothetical protein
MTIQIHFLWPEGVTAQRLEGKQFLIAFMPLRRYAVAPF